jgi:hypothetical protein
MAVLVETTTLRAEDWSPVSGGVPDQRSVKGIQVTPGTYATAQSRLVLDADGETVKFVPLDQGELDAPLAASAEAGEFVPGPEEVEAHEAAERAPDSILVGQRPPALPL